MHFSLACGLAWGPIDHSCNRVDSKLVMLLSVQNLKIMESANKDYTLVECGNQLSQPCSSDASENQLTVASTLEETLEAVKEKVWSFGGALKGVVDVLIGFGLSPSLLGYSSVPLNEDEYMKEKREDEFSLQKIVKDEILCGKSECGRLNENMHHRRSAEDVNFLQKREEDDYINHAFPESMRMESDERKSLIRSASRESLGESDLDEDKKDK